MECSDKKFLDLTAPNLAIFDSYETIVLGGSWNIHV
jgi:hypothetical protein